MRVLRSIKFCRGGLDLSRAGVCWTGSSISNSKEPELYANKINFNLIVFYPYLFRQSYRVFRCR
jgi:hypothetical protein